MKQALWFLLFALAFEAAAAVVDYEPAISALMVPVMLYAFYRGELWEAHDE